MGGSPQSEIMLMTVRSAAPRIITVTSAVVVVIVVEIVESSLPPLRPQAARVEGVCGLAVPAGMPFRDPPARAASGKLVTVLSGGAAALPPPPRHGAIGDGANATLNASPTPGSSAIRKQDDAAGANFGDVVHVRAPAMWRLARIDGVIFVVPASVDDESNHSEGSAPSASLRRYVSASCPRGPSSGRQGAARRGMQSVSPIAPAEDAEYTVGVDTRNHAEEVVEAAQASRLRPPLGTEAMTRGCHGAVAR